MKNKITIITLIVLLLIISTFTFIISENNAGMKSNVGARYAANTRNFEFDLNNIKYDIQHFGKEGVTPTVIAKDSKILMDYMSLIPLGKISSEQENLIDQINGGLISLSKSNADTSKSDTLKNLNVLIKKIDQINQDMKGKSNRQWYVRYHA